MKLSNACVACATWWLCAVAHGGGFQISEIGASGLARAYAGAGVAADGVADMFHNPASLMFTQGREIETAVHAIDTVAKFRNQGSITQGADADGGGDALVPNLFYATDWPRVLRSAKRLAKSPAHNRIRFGFGVTSPFGLTTKYPRNWIGRYHAVKSQLITLEVNPAVAVRINDALAIGGGVTYLQADAELSQMQSITVAPGTTIDAAASVKGDANGTGFTLGAIVGDDDTRIGFGYRSAVRLTIRGDVSLAIPNVSTTTAAASAKIELPASAYLSAYKRLSPKLEWFATWRRTDWSAFDQLHIDAGALSSTTQYQWRDSDTYSIALAYQQTPQWTWRFGAAVDETPIANSRLRTPRIPDANRRWLSLGGGWRINARTDWDFSLARIFADAVKVRNENLSGEYSASTNTIASIGLRVALP